MPNLKKSWGRIRSSFWFIPSLLVLGATVLALGVVALDRSITAEWLQGQPWAYTGGAEGASAVLSTIAGSMITISGVVFSITLVALSLAATQLGPRLLQNFMRDTPTQVVLGTFVAAFLYCLLVLRTIRWEESSTFVPHLAVTLGVVFALAGIVVLIYFIHHVAVLIQSDHVVARVGSDLSQGIDRLFPEQLGSEDSTEQPQADDGNRVFEEAGDWTPVPAPSDGYIEMIDGEILMKVARDSDLRVKVEHRPGRFVIAGRPLALVWPAERVTDDVVERVQRAFATGPSRTPDQDIEFPLNQLVEISARALSTGVNDPFTAISCIDRMASALCRLADRKMPSGCRRDESGRLRIVAPPTSFEEVADGALRQLRHAARNSPAVLLHLLEALEHVAGAVRRPADRAVLRRHAEGIAFPLRDGSLHPQDEHAVRAARRRTLEALSQ